MRNIHPWLPDDNSDGRNVWFPHKKLMEALEREREIKELEARITKNVLAQIKSNSKIEIDAPVKKEIEELRKAIANLMKFNN